MSWAKHKPKTKMHQTWKKNLKRLVTPTRMRFFLDVPLVSSFDLTGRTPKTETRSQNYACFRKSPLVT
ncbi:hypothetical protein Hanom_Chr10g00873661 [Helianthus anomalus]